MHDECISRRMAGMFQFEWAPCQGIKINGSGKIECMASWPSLVGGQKPAGTLVQSPSLIDHGRHGMAMFLELSSYILAPLLMMCLVSPASLRLAGARQVGCVA